MNDKTKMIVAVVCLAVAALAVAWQMGAFKSKPKGAQNTAEFEAELDEGEPVENTETVILPPQGGRSGLISQ